MGNFEERFEEDIEEKLWSYGLLSPTEREEVEQFARERPAFTAVLEEMKAFYALLSHAGLMDEASAKDAALAYYIIHDHLQEASLPVSLDAVYTRVKRELDENFEMRARYETIKSKMEEVASHSDPVAQFEELTGVRVESLPVQSKEPAFGQDRPERPPVVRERNVWSGWTRRSLYVAGITIAVLFLALWMNRVERMAYLDPALFDRVSPSGLRGGASPSEDNAPATSDREMASRAMRFNEGLEVQFQAQRVWLNVFFTFDGEKLKRAEDLFSQMLREEGIEPPLKDDVQYALAKIYIAQHQMEQARPLLEEIMRRGGAWRYHAERLLESL